MAVFLVVTAKDRLHTYLGAGAVFGAGACPAGGLGVVPLTDGAGGCLGACVLILGGCALPGLTLGACPGFGCCILGGVEIFGAVPAGGLGTAILLGAGGAGGCLGAVVFTFGGVLLTLGLAWPSVKCT